MSFLYSEYNTTGEYLQDGKAKWKELKMKNEALVIIYNDMNLNKSFRVSQCGSLLFFRRYKEIDKLKLQQGYFCKDRLCPMCCWRREKKIFHHLSKIMNVAEKEGKFIFLTLTLKNCKGEDLKDTLDLMFKAFNRLNSRKSFKKVFKGFYRILEITHNTDKESKDFNTFHPHFHIILLVNKSYFTSRDYIKQKEWVSMWRKVLNVDYEPIVDIRKVKNEKKVVYEATNTQKEKKKNIEYGNMKLVKYVSENDFLEINDDGELVNKEMSYEAVKHLNVALAFRRLIAFGGRFKEIKNELKLDDPESGDLIYVDGEEIRDDLEYVVEVYKWGVGIKGKNYYKLDGDFKDK